MKSSLKTKLSVIFLFLISLPLIILGTFSYIKSSNSIKVMAENNLKEVTNLTVENINNAIASVKSSAEYLSLSSDIVNLPLSPSDENKLKAFTYLSQIQKKNSKDIESLLVTDKQGKVITSNEKQSETLDLSDREYFKTTIQGKPSQSEVLKSKATGNSVIAIAYPISKDNVVLGTMVATVKFETISQHAAEIKIGENGYAYMLNKDGLFSYHPKSEKILKDNFFESKGAGLDTIIQDMKTGKSGLGQYTYEGVKKYVAFAPVGQWILATTADYNELMNSAINIRNYTILLTLVAILIAIVIAYFITTINIVRPIEQLESLMSKAGEGDLTVISNIKTGDEIQSLGESFNKMIESQMNIILKVREGAEELSSSSEEMAASSEEITAAIEQVTDNIQGVASDTEKQKNTIIETSQVLVQLSSLIQIAQNKAGIANENAEHTMEVALDGRKQVEKTVEAIKTIEVSTSETADTLRTLEELSKKVEGIITTINGISSQTNLLALNAAIEAARAGEHGRGFSVVADEVRKLSEQTALGANEIASLIGEMVKKIELAVKSMNTGKSSVDNGVAIVNETDKAFLSIISSIEHIVKGIGQVVEVTQDEVSSSDQIINLIDTISTLAEFNFTNSQEVASSSEEQTASVQNLSAAAQQTSALAYELNAMVEKFKV